ncbi:2-oxoadipate dehydrogenase complex component [Dirofilaria immitis]
MVAKECATATSVKTHIALNADKRRSFSDQRLGLVLEPKQQTHQPLTHMDSNQRTHYCNHKLFAVTATNVYE